MRCSFPMLGRLQLPKGIRTYPTLYSYIPTGFCCRITTTLSGEKDGNIRWIEQFLGARERNLTARAAVNRSKDEQQRAEASVLAYSDVHRFSWKQVMSLLPESIQVGPRRADWEAPGAL